MGAGHAHALHHHGHSVVHRLSPEVKVAATFLFVLGVALTPPQAPWAFAIDLVVLALVVRLSELPIRFVLRRLLVVLPFVLFAFLLPFIAGGEQVEVLGLSVSAEGLEGMLTILAKAGLGASASIVLAGTTTQAQILHGLERLRVPTVLTTIASFMLRYIDVLADEVGRMRTAMTARGYDPRWLWQAKPIASAAGALFIRSYERGERVHIAMVSRGFSGAMPDLRGHRAHAREWLLAAPVPAVALAAAVTSLVVT